MKKGLMLIATILLAVVSLIAQQTKSSSSPSRQSDSPTASDSQQITNGPVAEYVADSSATLGWAARNAGTTMTVKYGTDRAHLDQTATASQNAEGKNHHARLEGLTPETRYYFQVMQNGDAVGGIGTFITVASGSAPVKSKAVIPQ